MEMFDFILIIEKNVDSLLPIFKGKPKNKYLLSYENFKFHQSNYLLNYFPAHFFIILSIVIPSGLSNGNISARSQTKLTQHPMALATPNSTA